MKLAGIADHLEKHEAGHEFTREVSGLRRRAARAVGERPPRRPRCTRVVNGQHCGTRVNGMDVTNRPTDVLEHWRWCLCPGCGQTYSFDAQLHRLGQLRQQTLREWAAELGVEYEALRKRVNRVGLRADGRNVRMRNLCDRETITTCLGGLNLDYQGRLN